MPHDRTFCPSLSRPDNTSAEKIGRSVQTVGMAKEPIPASDYLELMRGRIRDARIARGLSQADVAKILRISRHNYEKYETRSKLPYVLVEPLALALGLSVSALITGHDERGRRAPERQPDLRG